VKVGYLHLGPEHDGVHRYGRMLAAEARRQGIEVVEVVGRLGRGVRTDARMVRQLTAELTGCDVVHLQYKSRYDRVTWGSGLARISNVRRFLATVPCPTVVTVHDAYPRRSLLRRALTLLRGADRSGGPTKALPRAAGRVGRVLSGAEAMETLALRTLLSRVTQVLVCTDEEAVRLRALDVPAELSVIPHFVEERELRVGRDEARAQLALGPEPVVTLLGFIHERKGHLLAVEALALADGILLVFAGVAGAGAESFLAAVLDRARVLGVEDRLRVTGYLAEPDLETWLAATDLAVCPFTFASASGSLATWLSASKPVLVSDLPQAAELNRLAPGALRTFAPYTPRALADGIRASLTERETGPAEQLRSILSLPRVFDLHHAVYQRCILPG
jgi:glycosyltransferase involved in cell wall biosynthesis